jgi:cytosine/adenosine deaminase-related metal-dependent hydrolase
MPMGGSDPTGTSASVRAVRRREFMRWTLALAAAHQAGAMAFPRSATAQGAPTPPAGREYVIRGGHVLSMDAAIGDFPVGDVHVRDGAIVATGANVDAAGAEVLDARGMIVLPGFVDTHSHLWNAFLRGSIRGDDPVRGYFPTTNRAAPLCRPEDAFNSVRFGLAEGLLSGITCVNNFSHNTRSGAHADAEIRATLETGARARFSYGAAGRAARIDLEDVERVKGQWLGRNALLTLGVNLQLPPPDVLKAGGEHDVFVKEATFARAAGLPISLHYGNTAHGLVAFMHKRGLLGPDVLLIHTQGFTPEERQQMVAAKVKFSMSPAIEIPYSTVRNGYIQFAELEELGAQLSLSVDASSAAASADFFTVMRALLWAHKQRADTKLKLAPKRIVEIATIEGARALGLDGRIGSLTPGKRGDLILIRRNDPNIAPVFEPYNSLVYSGQPANVDTVIVDGRVLIHRGRFTRLDIDKVVRAAVESATRIETETAKIIEKG